MDSCGELFVGVVTFRRSRWGLTVVALTSRIQRRWTDFKFKWYLKQQNGWSFTGNIFNIKLNSCMMHTSNIRSIIVYSTKLNS